MATRAVPRRASRTPSRDARWWVFMRVSGVLLTVLVLGHIVDTELVHDADDVDAEFVTGRWRNPFWRMWDGALLGLALVHGFHGVRTVVQDVVTDPRRRLGALTAVAAVATGLLLLAAVTVLGV